MSDKVVERVRLTKESSDYITEYGRKHNIPQRNRIINEIIAEHANFKSQEDQKNEFISAVSKNISKEINKEISRVRLGTNNTDRNTQILIELLNGFMFEKNVADIMTTEEGYTTNALNTARDVVQKRIEKMKQKKDEKLERSSE